MQISFQHYTFSGVYVHRYSILKERSFIQIDEVGGFEDLIYCDERFRQTSSYFYTLLITKQFILVGSNIKSISLSNLYNDLSHSVSILIETDMCI